MIGRSWCSCHLISILTFFFVLLFYFIFFYFSYQFFKIIYLPKLFPNSTKIILLIILYPLIYFLKKNKFFILASISLTACRRQAATAKARESVL